MVIARAYRTATAVVLCCLLLGFVSVMADESLPPLAQNTSVGSLITYANASLDRIVLIDNSSGKILSYVRSSEGAYRLKGLREFRKDLARTEADPVVSSLRPLPKDVLGEDPPGFERLKGGVRIASTHSDRGRSKTERWSARYVFSAAPETVLEQLWTRLSDWKVSETNFALEAQGARRASVSARKGRLRLVVRLTPRDREEDGECELWVSIEKVPSEES